MIAEPSKELKQKEMATRELFQSSEAKTIARKGGTMKTIALLVLLALGVISASGCHWLHHRRDYSRHHDSR